VSRGSWSRFYYQLQCSDGLSTTTSTIREIVFPPPQVNLSASAIMTPSFVPFPTAGTGIRVGVQVRSSGPEGVAGPIVVTSATLVSAFPRDLSGAVTLPRQVAPSLAANSMVRMPDDFLFRRVEVGAPAGALVLFRGTISWWNSAVPSGPGTLFRFAQRVRLPR
jgi:hypothetical protein